ncbi:uncharacterized protein [Enoplosus armatus]|uniref:uncharacterized protein n=1 Tax=Enoplosus armatus TaxID=215367 RepID=UPI003990F5C8
MMDNLTANKSCIPCQSWADQNGWSTTSTQGPLLNPLANSQHLSLGSSSNQRPSYDHLQASSQSCMSDLSTLSSGNNAHHSALYKASHISSDPSSTTLFANAAMPRAYVEFAGVAGYTHSHASSTSQEQRQWIPSSHCSGAVNESVPDEAAHLNKEPSQQGNISPPTSNERRRSVLIHQRAQLLQQLAELDKLLESTPPDDSSDGQSPNTAIQSPSMDKSSQCEQNKTSDAQQAQLSAGKSKSHLSADCSSPASFDEQSETCDTPEDPMLGTESVT